MRKQQGFTLIELVMVIVVLGILAAIAVPKFVDLSTDATNAAKAGSKGAVKSALTISTGQLKRAPTLSELIGNVQGAQASPGNNGVDISFDSGTTWTQVALTYTDNACTTATSALANTVQCVK